MARNSKRWGLLGQLGQLDFLGLFGGKEEEPNLHKPAAREADLQKTRKGPQIRQAPDKQRRRRRLWNTTEARRGLPKHLETNTRQPAEAMAQPIGRTP